jgi:hypothetical protein
MRLDEHVNVKAMGCFMLAQAEHKKGRLERALNLFLAGRNELERRFGQRHPLLYQYAEPIA